jgi:hypothetical protein
MIPAYDLVIKKLIALMITMHPKTWGRAFNSDPGMEKLNLNR